MKYSVTEVAAFRLCSRQYILQLIHNKKLKAEKVGNTYIINENECIKLWGEVWKLSTKE